MAKKKKKINAYVFALLLVVAVAALVYFAGDGLKSINNKQVTFTISDAVDLSNIREVNLSISKILVHDDKQGIWLPVNDNIPEINLKDLTTHSFILGTVNVSDVRSLGEVKMFLNGVEIVDNAGVYQARQRNNVIVFHLDFNTTESDNVVDFDFNLANSIESGAGGYDFKPYIMIKKYAKFKPSVSSTNVCKMRRTSDIKRCVVKPTVNPTRQHNVKMGEDGRMVVV